MNTIRIRCGRATTKDIVQTRLSTVLLPTQTTSILKITKGDGYDSANVQFDNPAIAQDVLQVINVSIPEWQAYLTKSQQPSQQPQDDSNNNKLQVTFPPSNSLPHSAANAVAPWRDIPYSQQLLKKKLDFLAALKQWRGSLRHSEKSKRTEMGIASSGGGTLINTWLDTVEQLLSTDVIPSPLQSGYRNKNDFTIALDKNGLPTLGFRVGTYEETQMLVESPEECTSTVADIALQISSFITNWIRTKSKLKPFDNVTDTGLWRGVTIRHSVTSKEVMVTFRVSTIHGEEGKLELQQCTTDLMKQNFPHTNDDCHQVTCVMVQWWDGKSQLPMPNTPYELVAGQQSYIKETLLGMDFRVSPGAFFQINTLAANVLFDLVRNILIKIAQQPASSSSSSSSSQLLSTTSNSSNNLKKIILFDICCGTGVIGLLMSHVVNHVIGIELSTDAIADARVNATMNGLQHKSRFVCGKAEDVLPRILLSKRIVTNEKKCPSPQEEEELLKCIDDIERIVGQNNNNNITENTQYVVIVDPPRAGLARDTLTAMRNTDQVSKIIYVSCNPAGSFLTDANVLCQSCTNTLSGVPFKITHMQLLDQFPHSEHCEGVFLLERDLNRPAHPTHEKRVAMRAKREAEKISGQASSSSGTSNVVVADEGNDGNNNNNDNKKKLKLDVE
jgi:tRNA (uracil-5-)-methyltransferase